VAGDDGDTPGAAPDGGPLTPPVDADDWTDAQWLAYLTAIAEEDDEPAPTGSRMARSAGGQVLGNAMLGLAQAMYGVTQPEVVVEADVPGGSGDDDLVVRLDPDHPERSTVVSRRRRGRGRRPAG
jgi:hypothetical protein